MELLTPKQREAAFPLSTRISEQVKNTLKAITDTGVSQRDAIEYAIMRTYASQEPAVEENPEAKARRQAEARQAYMAALGVFFDLVEQPAGDHGAEHRAQFQAANEAVKVAHEAFMDTWE